LSYEIGPSQQLPCWNRRYRRLKKKISEVKSLPESSSGLAGARGVGKQSIVVPPNLKSLEHTRIEKPADKSEFIEQRRKEIKPTPIQMEGEISDAEEVEAALPNVSEPAPVAPAAPLPELGLNEPPESVEPTPEPQDWAHSISETQIMEWWVEFADTQSMRVSSLMKTIRPKSRGNEIVAIVHPGKVDMFDAVKFPFGRFILEKSEGKLSQLVIEPGEIEETERKPYTEREKLEYLMKKNPGLDDFVKKLGLLLP
jgi:hypothetical protein